MKKIMNLSSKFFSLLVLTVSLHTPMTYSKLFPEAEKRAAQSILKQCYKTENAKKQIALGAHVGKVASISVGGVGAVTLLMLIGKNLSDKQKPSTLRTHATKALFLSLILMGAGDFGYGICSRLDESFYPRTQRWTKKAKKVTEKLGL